MEVFNAVGRRKAAIAKIFIKKGKGEFSVNSRTFDDYFNVEHHKKSIKEPLTLLEIQDKYDVMVKVKGGGFKGQAEAVRLGLARVLCEVNPDFRATLKSNKLLTRDSRVVERKKSGLRKARKASQFSKR
ncbi:MAG: 30S ribosomal protein S9 [Bacteroidetes bacterium]|nr:30S ribosomal protein S9 [Bacteroidota bacterium]